ncbi:hypothetical protein ACWDSD_34210 [Streptomyces spiralis]
MPGFLFPLTLERLVLCLAPPCTSEFALVLRPRKAIAKGRAWASREFGGGDTPQRAPIGMQEATGLALEARIHPPAVVTAQVRTDTPAAQTSADQPTDRIFYGDIPLLDDP